MSDKKTLSYDGESEEASVENASSGRRRVPRRAIQRRVGLLVEGKYHIATAFEIGEGGMLIEALTPLRIDQRVVLTVRIPGVLQGVMLSTVVYKIEPKKPGDKTRYGVQFDKIDFDIKRRIRNFVASSSQSQEDAA